MKRFAFAVRHLLVVGALGAAALFGTATPAAAATVDQVQIQPPTIVATASCDVAARQWVVTWQVTNPNTVAGTLGNLRVTPLGQPLVGLPNRMFPGMTIVGTQRVGGAEPSASITFDVNWDVDQIVTYNHSQSIRFGTTCGQPSRTVLVSSTVACDLAARQFVITYNFTNPNPLGATLGNIRVTPAGFPLAGQFTRILPLATVSGVQRIPGNQQQASVTFDVNFDDNTVVYDISHQVVIPTTCGFAA
jgi:hypothetical protein